MAKIAILGFGVVGSGVAEVMSQNSDKIARNASMEVGVKYIVDVRDFPESPFSDLIIKDFSLVENDPEVEIVVETIGGTGVAYDFTRRALLKGKSVVTSNKELVALHGYELLNIAREKNVNYLFEASVGGGIPIIRPLSQCLAANKIDEIYGILNGTTNYILTEMFKNGLPFDTALKQAQEKGYAEANPTADVDGHDAARKICILSALCFGRHLYPDQVSTMGIGGVTATDIAFAEKGGYKIKLLGRAVQIGDDKASAYVAPHLLSGDHLIAGVEGVMNAIVVKGNAIGEVMFYGAGAGKLPTASAVVADVIDAAKHLHSRKFINWEDGGADYAEPAEFLKTRWYVRIEGGEIPAGCESLGTENGEAAFITEAFDKKGIDAANEGKTVLSMFRVLD